MKKLLLILLLSPVISNAQFQVVVGSGITFNSAPKGLDDRAGSYGKENGLLNYAMKMGVGFALNKHWIIGIGAEYYKLNTKTDISSPDLNASRTLKIYYADPVIPLYAYTQRKFNLHKSYFYIGINAGVAITTLDRTKYYSESQAYAFGQTIHSIGYTVGLQAGYNIYISNHLSIFADGNFRYLYIKTSYNDTYNRLINKPYGMFSYPLFVGMKYSI